MVILDYASTVHWNGTDDWMTRRSTGWRSATPPDWVIPGWVVGNPLNTASSTDLAWNMGYAHIDRGRVDVTAGFKQEGTVRTALYG